MIWGKGRFTYMAPGVRLTADVILALAVEGSPGSLEAKPKFLDDDIADFAHK